MRRTLSALAVALVMLLGIATAQQTPAGTSISNQASASYIDSAGQARNTTSNQVITVVQQVYGFTITPNSTHSGSPATIANLTAPGQTRQALPGAPVYFAYTVSNSGNGTDTISLTTAQDTGGSATDNFDFTGVTIYRDDNCDGTVDAGEAVVASVSLTRASTATASVCIVVAATIPASATNNQVGNLNLSGAGGGSTTDVNNWARGTATTAAAIDITKGATPSGTVSPGSAITYTITGQNRGGSAASGVSVSGLAGTGILVSDPIPNGLSVPSAPTGSAGAGSVQMVYSTNGGSTWSTTAPSFPFAGDAAGNNRVGMYISGSGAFFTQTASYTFSFQVSVPAAAAQGTSYSNTATLQYNNGAAQTITSNTVTNTVGATYSVAVGPNGSPTGGASGTYTAGGYTITRSGDTQTIASVYNGQYVAFYHTLRNTGNTSDSYTLAVAGAPAGWSCSFVQNDHVTPISGAVGPFAAASDFNFDLVCFVPATYTSASAVNLTVTATSVNDASKTDTSSDSVSAVVSGYNVDMAARGNGGDGNAANDNPAGQNANPGSTVNFSFEVVNTGQNADNYNLSAPTLPSSWSVVFYPDADCNGVMDTPTPAPVTSTGLVNTGIAGRKCFIAAVQVPATAAPGSNALVFRADSTTDAGLAAGVQPASSDSISTSVSVNLVSGFVFDPDRSGTVTSPGTIVYTHNLINNGNASATVAIPAVTSTYGWVYQFSTDNATWASSLSGLALAANGGSQLVYVRVLIPGGEPIGRSESMIISANATYTGGGSASDTVTDTTTIVGGDLRLTKSAVSFVGATATQRSATGATALPGDQIVYTVVAENIGTANLTAVKISDPLPAYTSFVSVSASTTIAGGTVVYSTDGITWSTTAPLSLAAGQEIYVAVNTAGAAGGANSIDASDAMPAGSTITITFRVQVQ